MVTSWEAAKSEVGKSDRLTVHRKGSTGYLVEDRGIPDAAEYKERVYSM